MTTIIKPTVETCRIVQDLKQALDQIAEINPNFAFDAMMQRIRDRNNEVRPYHEKENTKAEFQKLQDQIRLKSKNIKETLSTLNTYRQSKIQVTKAIIEDHDEKVSPVEKIDDTPLRSLQELPDSGVPEIKKTETEVKASTNLMEWMKMIDDQPEPETPKSQRKNTKKVKKRKK